MRYFQLSEFDSPDAPGSGSNMDSLFLEMLDTARDLAGIPFVVTSGYRTPSHNASEGGKHDSAHLRGLAADIAAPTSGQKYLIVRAAFVAGFCRIGIGSTFVHLDCAPDLPQDVIWTY
jgi:zinc D-Ala-D-Ala carboxypeptidase